MTEIEKLKFQSNIENIKEHVRIALSGGGISSYVNRSYHEVFYCTECRQEAYNDEEIQHKEDCHLLKKWDSASLLREWVN